MLRKPFGCLLLAMLVLADCTPAPDADRASAGGPILDKRAQLARFDFWDNQDVDWFAERIPFLHTPDDEIDATWYYRWEVLTKHLVYGSPEVGYTFTEFIDRPFWSGAYGGISCPLGHQMYEVRWLKDRRIVDDFARYWIEAPGAEPRSYSNWYADAVWATYRVLGDRDWVLGMRPLMEAQYAGWLEERWDPEHRMFVWDGMHDGMETNIDSRQTPQWFDGAPGYRPTLNSYLWADAMAIAQTAALAGDTAAAAEWRERADDLRARVHEELWDPERRFFFHQFARDEETVADPWPGAGNRAMGAAAVAGARIAADGSTPPITAKSLTYESGPWAGDPHGRELIGYVPWQFGLPESGYEDAWAALFDGERFWSEYGPTTTEKNDPLYYVSPRCCVWSGNSWPYATTQTLVALANLLNDYEQDLVDAADYVALLRAYTRTQRQNGRPYVAEAADPETGSWAGHDSWFHSEHYLHSGYVDPVITGLIGLRPQDDDRVEVNPLVPTDWDWFVLDDVAYRGHSVSVLWDRDGSRFERGAGLQLIVDGETVASAPELGRLEATLEPADTPAIERRHNLAVRNDATWFPAVTVSSARPEAPGEWAVDGQFWYHTTPPNRWVPSGEDERDWIEVDFGIARRFDTVKLYFLDDEARPPDPVAERAPEFLRGWLRADDGLPVAPPAAYRVQARRDGEWEEVAAGSAEAENVASAAPNRAAPRGRRATVVTFPEILADAVRVELEHRPATVAGLSELEIWSDEPLPFAPPTAPPANLAHVSAGATITASHAGGGAPAERLIDGLVAFNLYTDAAWTSAGSEAEADWLEVELAQSAAIDRVELYLWAWPERGTAPPRAYTIEVETAAGWESARERRRDPQAPRAMARNVVEIEPVRTRRVRVRLEHASRSATGVTELRVFGRR